MQAFDEKSQPSIVRRWLFKASQRQTAFISKRQLNDRPQRYAVEMRYFWLTVGCGCKFAYAFFTWRSIVYRDYGKRSVDSSFHQPPIRDFVSWVFPPCGQQLATSHFTPRGVNLAVALLTVRFIDPGSHGCT